VLPARSHFLAVNSVAYSGSVPGDQTYANGIASRGGIALLNSTGAIVDAAGMCSSTAYYEGTPLDPLVEDSSRSYERKPGGSMGSTQDTDNNYEDFALRQSSDPQNLSSPPIGPSPTPTATPTNTPTTTPGSSASLIGHVTWQGSTQPNARQIQTATLTLCVSSLPQSHVVTTDAGGFFTLTTSLPDGAYNWRIKNFRTLANAGALTISGGAGNQEMGVMVTGDANDSNAVNASDFVIMKVEFGISGAGLRSDFDNNGVTNATDFTLLKANFSLAGATANCP
jgi:hypothetical protein